jgi:uncharacterized protein (DUF433 family)
MASDRRSSLQEVISVNPKIMSGTPCFAGTRVPVQTLLDYLEEGDTINRFLVDFPAVRRSQAIQFLNLAKDQLIECVSS